MRRRCSVGLAALVALGGCDSGTPTQPNVRDPEVSEWVDSNLGIEVDDGGIFVGDTLFNAEPECPEYLQGDEDQCGVWYNAMVRLLDQMENQGGDCIHIAFEIETNMLNNDPIQIHDDSVYMKTWMNVNTSEWVKWEFSSDVFFEDWDFDLGRAEDVLLNLFWHEGAHAWLGFDGLDDHETEAKLHAKACSGVELS